MRFYSSGRAKTVCVNIFTKKLTTLKRKMQQRYNIPQLKRIFVLNKIQGLLFFHTLATLTSYSRILCTFGWSLARGKIQLLHREHYVHLHPLSIYLGLNHYPSYYTQAKKLSDLENFFSNSWENFFLSVLSEKKVNNLRFYNF